MLATYLLSRVVAHQGRGKLAAKHPASRVCRNRAPVCNPQPGSLSVAGGQFPLATATPCNNRGPGNNRRNLAKFLHDRQPPQGGTTLRESRNCRNAPVRGIAQNGVDTRVTKTVINSEKAHSATLLKANPLDSTRKLMALQSLTSIRSRLLHFSSPSQLVALRGSRR